MAAATALSYLALVRARRARPPRAAVAGAAGIESWNGLPRPPTLKDRAESVARGPGTRLRRHRGERSRVALHSGPHVVVAEGEAERLPEGSAGILAPNISELSNQPRAAASCCAP